MPKLPPNVYKTPHGYLFRIAVPEALRAEVCKREIKQSLGKDFQKALSQALVLAVQVNQKFATLRAARNEIKSDAEALQAFIATPADKRLKPITAVTPELIEGLQSLWLSALEADLAWRKEGIDDQEFDELQENVAQIKASLAKALARGKAEPFIPVIRSLLAGRGYLLTVSPEEERRLVLDVLPAIQEGYDILEQRQSGRMAKPPKAKAPPLHAAWQQPFTSEGQGLSWEHLFDHWRMDRERPPRTLKEVEALIKSIEKLLPHSSPATLTKAEVTEWLRNERKKNGNSAKTLEKKGTLVGALFSTAVKDDLIEKNPFSNFDYKRFASKEGAEDPDAREPFSLDQLRAVFSEKNGLFENTTSIGGGGYHARIWMPLLALYSGARLDEIGSLTINDIKDKPVPHFCIRQAKTHSSIREVPLHPKLVELGFLRYVAAVRRAGHVSLWPLLRTESATASPSETLGKWFNRFIHVKLGFPRNVVFHSFRHTFKDLCRDALIPRDVHHALTGHAKETVGDAYGKGFSLEVKLEQLKKIEIDLNIPKPLSYKSKNEKS